MTNSVGQYVSSFTTIGQILQIVYKKHFGVFWFTVYIRKESLSSSCYTTSAYSVVDSPIRVESSDLAYSSITSWLGNETGGENFSNSSSRHGASLLVLDPDATHHTPQSEFWTERKTNPKSEVAQ